MSSDADIDSLVATLRAAFPAHSDETVAKALKTEQYNVDATAAKLLLLSPSNRGPQQQQQRRRSTRFSGQVCADNFAVCVQSNLYFCHHPNMPVLSALPGALHP